MTQEELKAHAQAIHDAVEPVVSKIRRAVPGVQVTVEVGPVDRFQQGPARVLVRCRNLPLDRGITLLEQDIVRPDDVGPLIEYLNGGERPGLPPPDNS